MKTKVIPYSRQSISKADIESVKKTLISDFLTTGPQISKFEKNFKIFKCKVCCMCKFSNKCPSYILSCSRSKKKEQFWTSTNSFVASANCGELCGAKLDLIDISLEDFNLSVEKLTKKLKQKNQSCYSCPSSRLSL